MIDIIANLIHAGSSGSMESDGIVDCFENSIFILINYKYTTYIGDGDTKSHANVVVF